MSNDTATSKLDPIPPFDRRRARATAIVGSMMHVIAPLLPDEARPGRIADALLQLFYETDAEIITEHDRREAGLPARNAIGLTPEEHRAIEAKRMDLLLRPAPPMVIVGGSAREKALEQAVRAFVYLFDHDDRGREKDQLAGQPDNYAYEFIMQAAHRDVPISMSIPVITVGQIRRAREALKSGAQP